ncbi:MAG TPA: response regulator, partial [Vicinamibacteria bacterium]|nr:response regulator [Vicinamibacteria bacterium]
VPALEWLVPWMKERHDLTVALDVEPGPWTTSEDVALLVFRSVRELLFNTVKHARVDTARLRVRHRDESVEIEVSDEGAGFAPTPADRMSREGGFGLFSVRERIGLLGGQMVIDSAPGRGTRILLRVPSTAVAATASSGATSAPAPAVAAPKPQAVREATAAPATREAQDRIRVVVVDDHAVALQGLTDLLGAAPDIEVVGQAADGQEAVEVVRRLAPDVVTMDVSLPRMDGIEATRRIKEALPGVRVIGLSMFEEGEQAEALRRAGAVSYLTKSGPISALLDEIRRWAAPKPATAASPPGPDKRAPGGTSGTWPSDKGPRP